MEETGCSREEVMSLLAGYRARDVPHERIFSSMCTVPHKIALEAHEYFASTNLGDPGLYPGTAEIERKLISDLGSLLHGKDIGGYATSGGTESNLQAVRIAKKLHPTDMPNIVVPASAHFSFDKTSDILGVEMRMAPYKEGEYTVDTDKMAELVDKNTIAVACVAGTTEYGVIDDVKAVADIARENDIWCHVDAAFGGLVIPFMKNPAPFDFAIDGVSSITLDPHKMGMSTIPCGTFLIREPENLKLLSVDSPYLTMKTSFTLTGTRPGADVAGAYAVLKYLGREGFCDIVSGCLENTRRLVCGMEAFGYKKVLTPVMNLAAFYAADIPDGWKVSRTRAGHMRFVMMPHVTRDVVETFLDEVSMLH
ncbi:MAG TPA: tyrosine decarboxylase MfnA [Methanocorpusculum sp.]|jgi:tyrosine decarboxylase/aspartate 1-decarboxylase|nr:tyrosine decarboxylase MfnA [Methanocorpusculum sp.]MBR5815682.1 tyrosine decarboxylase MfnA [Methanocorpusculaceae archaeon]HJJ64927.1 tyrosine decarboxylase MfnA [Methanocorpusculum sp.]HJJ84639.1 tyrosine decarboxylase MfnA [Methanocorpusculum sp.]